MTKSFNYNLADPSRAVRFIAAKWPALNPICDTVERIFFDTFDERLAAAKMFLYVDRNSSGSRIYLMAYNGRELARIRVARLPADPLEALGHNRAAAQVRRITAPRALLVQAHWQVARRRWRWRGKRGKTIAELTLEQHSFAGQALITTLARRLKPRCGSKLRAGFKAMIEPLKLELLGAPAIANIPILYMPEGAPPASPSPTRARVDGSAALLDLDRDASAPAAMARMIGVLQRLMREQEFGIIRDIDIEFLHDFRIALRKARSLFSCADLSSATNTSLNETFRWLNKLSGRQRDLDVWRDEAKAEIGFDADLLARIEMHRTAAQRAMAQALTSTRYSRFHQTLDETLATMASADAPESTAQYLKPRIKQRWMKLVQRSHKYRKTISQARLHQLRKNIKQLRYVLEACAVLYRASDLVPALAALKLAQDEAGRRCDFYARRELLEQWEVEAKDPAKRAAIAEARRRCTGTDPLRLSRPRYKQLKNALAPLQKPQQNQSLSSLFGTNQL